MTRRRSKILLAGFLPLLAALFFVAWLFLPALYAWSCGDRAGSSSPRAVLRSIDRDLGTVTQGTVVETSFPVANAGRRRLVIVEHAKGCCGDSSSSREIIVPPGDWTELTVKVDTAQWWGRMEHTVRYTTNDPSLPQFTLKITGDVESAPVP